MSNFAVLQGLLPTAVLCLSEMLFGGLLFTSLPANAQQVMVTAQKVQQHVAAIETRHKGQKPFLKRHEDIGIEGADAVAWGAPDAIEKISVKYQGERGETLQDFYWDQGVLIAARVRRIDYGAYTASLPSNRPWPRKLIEDDRYEFAGEVTLRRRSFGRVVPTVRRGAEGILATAKAHARSYKRLMDIPETKENKYGECTWSCTRNQNKECLAYSCK